MGGIMGTNMNAWIVQVILYYNLSQNLNINEEIKFLGQMMGQFWGTFSKI